MGRGSAALLFGANPVPAGRREESVGGGYAQCPCLKVGKMEDGVTELRMFIGAMPLVLVER